MAGTDILKVVKDILIILILLAVLAGIVLLVLNISKLFGALGSLMPNPGNGQSLGSNQTYNQGNQQYRPQNQSNNSDNSQYQAISDIANQLKSAVDSGDWSTADRLMAVIDSMASQLPPEVQPFLSQLDDTVRNRDRSTFDSVFAQAQQAADQYSGQNQGGNQSYSGNPGDWCVVGTYGGSTPGVPSDSTILGLADHNGRQMCHFTYEGSSQGVSVNGDCYFDKAEVCCALTINGQVQQEMCTPVSQ